jgi:hypothetical protein
MGVLSDVVATLLRAMGQTKAHKATAPAWWWSRVQISADSDPQMARLRLFSRLRGIELPYRTSLELGRRAAGLASAVGRVSQGSRADVIVLISDLRGLLERPDVTLKSLARARRGGQRVLAIAPFGPAFAPTPSSAAARAVADVLTLDERLAFEEGRRLLVRHGIPVIEAGPQDNPVLLLRKIARARSSMRRVA